MKLSDLKQYDLIYLGTPYTRYPGGIEVAFVDAARLTAQLISEGLSVYSPIVHMHPIAVHGGIDPMDHSIWLPIDAVMMRKSAAMLVAKMTGWENSFGINHEVEEFDRAKKPVFFLDPSDLSITEGAAI